jgi:hypothetical protein
VGRDETKGGPKLDQHGSLPLFRDNSLCFPAPHLHRVRARVHDKLVPVVNLPQMLSDLALSDSGSKKPFWYLSD